MGCRISDVLRHDVPVVDAGVDEFVGGVRGHVGDLDGVVDAVVHFAVGAAGPGDPGGGDAAQVGFDFDEGGHAFCGGGGMCERGPIVGWGGGAWTYRLRRI